MSEASTTAAEPVVETRSAQAERIIRRNVIWSMGAGLVPVPFADLAAVVATQVKLASELAKLYGTPYAEERTRTVSASLLASLGVFSFGRALVGSMLKTIPVIGSLAGIAVVPVVAGASTYALGKVFVAHFESGGTLLTLDPEKMKAYYAQHYKAGEDIAQGLKAEAAAGAK